jgi:predicted aldo/keto reductase-like oxidoreductase
MNYVTLGKTGLKAAVVSFGGIPIQRADGANTKAVVDKLEEYGINYIDTARGYTVSEEYLGAALEGRRDKFILATKSMSRDAASMAADVETSLRNLRTGYIDLYQLHNLPEKDIEKVFGPGGAYEALTDEQKATVTGAELFDSLFDCFNGMVNALAEAVSYRYYENGQWKTGSVSDYTEVISQAYSEFWENGCMCLKQIRPSIAVSRLPVLSILF